MGHHYSRLYKIDDGSITPLGLYNNNKRYNVKLVRKCIINRKLSPFYKGLSDPIHTKEEEEMNYSIECPICFLYYPSNINFTRCCKHPICTECFVQIKHCFKLSVPCPFCMTNNVDVHYQSPKQIKSKCINKKNVVKRRRLLPAMTNVVMASK
ncbi:hypothetical protein K501DRAFT_276475 [Backusella circina FSU 941]|nr:hypothetical protein K501DRAFT_276475 [Backusella circina FSU 941]